MNQNQNQSQARALTGTVADVAGAPAPAPAREAALGAISYAADLAAAGRSAGTRAQYLRAGKLLLRYADARRPPEDFLGLAARAEPVEALRLAGTMSRSELRVGAAYFASLREVARRARPEVGARERSVRLPKGPPLSEAARRGLVGARRPGPLRRLVNRIVAVL
jgi:hypothetical protein